MVLCPRKQLHTETGPQFKCSFEKLKKLWFDLEIPGLVVQCTTTLMGPFVRPATCFYCD